MWYRLAILTVAGDITLTSPDIRVWGRPRWSQSGHLAVGGLVGIRRVVLDIDVATAAVTCLAIADDASYELLDYVDHGHAVCRRRGLDGSAVLVRRRAGEVDETLEREHGALPPWRNSTLVRWRTRGCELEGILVPPEIGEPPWTTVTFLHGGPVGALVIGEQQRVGAWADRRWATFVPDFPASGSCGEAAMLDAFEASELPQDDHEVDAVLAGLDELIAAETVDSARQFIVGHSYGAYLVNRALTRTARFRAAVCWDGVADLRLLADESLAMQSQWRGGSPHDVPERWSAASPIDRVHHVRTPTLLVYGARSPLVGQGEHWREALHSAGVKADLFVQPDSGHTFDADATRTEFHERVAAWFQTHGGPPP